MENINRSEFENEVFSDFLGIGKKAKAKREAKRELRDSGMSRKESRKSIKNSPCGNKPKSKKNADIDSWRTCLKNNGIIGQEVDEAIEDFQETGNIDLDVTDDELKGGSNSTKDDEGGNTLMWVGIGVGSVLIIGVTAWLLFRKK